MSHISRFSSRREVLAEAFLAPQLKDARSYKRIAGYFRSSIFELVGEEVGAIPDVKVVCNSDLDIADVAAAKEARDAALKERWNEADPEIEALLRRDRYRKLYDLLSSGNVEIRVVPRERTFLHGKAGVIERQDGSKTAFLGSINETRNAFDTNYEILWADDSPAGVEWVEEEFEALWKDAYPLPEAIIQEVKRVADRVEIRFDEVREEEVPEAALAEAPIYRGGEQLQPWQQAFVTTFLSHRETYGEARLLLADEVGLGKTLSLGASAMLSVLLEDGPVLILCPSTLTLQWQVELNDHLGIPSAVWLSNAKVWLDPKGHTIRTRGPEDIANCPFQIAIVSTGLVTHRATEADILLRPKYGTIILDEAHKARKRGGLGQSTEEPNNLLRFMLAAGHRTINLLLGTATPIQTDVQELWDLLGILNSGSQFVMGQDNTSRWVHCADALPVVIGRAKPEDPRESWEWVRNPLPPGNENALFKTLRLSLRVPDNQFFSNTGFASLSYPDQQALGQTLASQFFPRHNPVIRHTVLRRRSALEKRGLLPRIAVDVHPDPNGGYPGVTFVGLALQTNHNFERAYQSAEDFAAALTSRSREGRFVKTILLQRLCSSFASGKATALKLLSHTDLEDEDQAQRISSMLSNMSADEQQSLQDIVSELSRPEARDPKLGAVHHFLTEVRIDGRNWLEHGCIVFSQYYDTAHYIAAALADSLPTTAIGLYAGADKSRLFRERQSAAVERDDIKAAVKERDIRLVVATDAACEGLNLQTLGTLINVDLPWNPAKLEQRLGRIKRIGQARSTIDMLNLVYQNTQDEKVYSVLSQRMKDRYDIFGGLPDEIEDDWIGSVEALNETMDHYIHLRDSARNAFDLKYESHVNPDLPRWDLASRVFSRRDIIEKLSRPW